MQTYGWPSVPSLCESCHPSHTKSSIIFSQALRMRRICSKKSDLVANVGKLKDWLTRKQKGHLKHLEEVYQVIVELRYP